MKGFDVENYDTEHILKNLFLADMLSRNYDISGSNSIVQMQRELMRLSHAMMPELTEIKEAIKMD